MQTADRLNRFRESVIRDMTRLAIRHEAINLSQGFPDYAPPAAITEAAIAAIQAGLNQYSVTWGYPPLRHKLAELYTQRLGWEVRPDEHVTVVCGVTEGITAVAMAILNPGDEMIVLEPAHENFRPAVILAGAEPVSVALEAPAYRLDAATIETAVSPRTKAILLNTPHNPTGRVFSQAELDGLIQVILKHDLILITDEIYDRILYDGRQHISPGSLAPLRDRTITVGGLGKTFAVTGWRLGYIIAPAELTQAVRPLHDYMTICAATPLQAAAAAALNLPESFFEQTRQEYHVRRNLMMTILAEVGFQALVPEGAYYVMADYKGLPVPQAELDPMAFALFMVQKVGVAVVPGNNFYSLPGYGESTVRFAFPKQLATLQEAGERMLARLR